jgi:hypothetical protein
LGIDLTWRNGLIPPAAVKLQFISAIRNGMLDAENKPACGGRVELRASMPYRTGSNERQLLAGYEQAALIRSAITDDGMATALL